MRGRTGWGKSLVSFSVSSRIHAPARGGEGLEHLAVLPARKTARVTRIRTRVSHRRSTRLARRTSLAARASRSTSRPGIRSRADPAPRRIAAVGIPAATQKANPTLSIGPLRPVRQHRVASYRRVRPAGNITCFPRQPNSLAGSRVSSPPCRTSPPDSFASLMRPSRIRRPFDRSAGASNAVMRDAGHAKPTEPLRYASGSHAAVQTSRLPGQANADFRTSARRTRPAVPGGVPDRAANQARAPRRPAPTAALVTVAVARPAYGAKCKRNCLRCK
jgi:hypothetical protein